MAYSARVWMNRPVFLIFFLMTRPPPRSTLFPYTTLFRPRTRRHRAAEPVERPVARAVAVAARADRDRKSTRLNSSHLGISYAVFCLKKKKNADMFEEVSFDTLLFDLGCKEDANAF